MRFCKNVIFIAVLFPAVVACEQRPAAKAEATVHRSTLPQPRNIGYANAGVKVIHVFVALCDNKYQGIVPVPPGIGNGQDPETNLYWGCDNGVRTYFKKSKDWQLVKKDKAKRMVMERLIFKHRSQNVYLVADAWDGRAIEKTTEDFLFSCSGQLKDTVHHQNKVLGIGGNAQLVAYIGHDGLMDFRLADKFENADGKTRDCIILACISKKYFGGFIAKAKATPLVWTTGLMCPEAYTLHDAITGYLQNESHQQIRGRAAAAYAKYQKCSVKAATNLLVSGL
nr:hypothetical protein [uncultured Mucilaginibacter sp.]